MTGYQQSTFITVDSPPWESYFNNLRNQNSVLSIAATGFVNMGSICCGLFFSTPFERR
ncbi:uncharacterized protein Dvar_04610 [Desulfosarcina variabilis str. Montpellier]